MCAPPPGCWKGAQGPPFNEELAPVTLVPALTPADVVAPPWRAWSQVPDDPESARAYGPFFLEIFSVCRRWALPFCRLLISSARLWCLNPVTSWVWFSGRRSCVGRTLGSSSSFT